MNIEEALRYGAGILKDSGVPDALLDSRLLLCHGCGFDRSYTYGHPERELSSEEESTYRELIAARAARIPLQHITGEQEFMGLTFEVNKSVLIPRQDTEILVEEVLRDLHSGSSIIDLCTGSGCILISLLKYSNDCTGLGIDISEEALALAERNAGLNLTETGNVRFAKGDVLDPGYLPEGEYDYMTANPPYIRTAQCDELMPEVRDHDPRLALDGGEDGLVFYRRIAELAGRIVKRGGEIFLEIGSDQGEAVRDILEGAGLAYIEVIKDYAGLDRVVRAVVQR